ncbi:methylmalonyl-CoA mutase family protein [Heyndrickxia sporothermodurans]|uniref:methylmalonyl-CoA mutase family protein n=1 Tax=Heyndrickxia sporothermodurans TaxID=46224 RepID=UPI002E1C900C|nr:methylmalonyl-CoA mutase family protein [Heyndrickxia sporothermodurans]MED3650885.1 methylmalonyl-CoA mutase family protein [Heyndrickxia sporothermodurans]MED3699650.1 methylmalonyl-CoA mutase family protein [Heyndrickxia sporothermodurans]
MGENVKELKNQTFQAYSVMDWEDAANQTLKNRNIDSLSRSTYENIMLKPLYTKEDIEHLSIEQYPRSGLNTRGFDEFENSQNKWQIAQKLTKTKWADLHPIVADLLKRGQEVLAIDIDRLNDIDQVNFMDIEELDLSRTPIFIQTKFHFKTMLAKLREIPNKEQLKGILGTDIISKEVENGDIPNSLSSEMNNWLQQIKLADQEYNALKTVLIDTTPYHNGGANAVQEIAIALSEAVYYIERLKEANWEPGKTARKLVFHFSIGGNFFMEIAKLRAFRKLWSTIGNAYEMTLDEQAVPISAETSMITKSKLDPYVNILRAGNEAFSAILGGVNLLHVSAFDEIYKETNEFSARISRNIQLLLREEAHLNKVSDPAGGSYYIETLTNELVKKSWELFQLIDRKGGIVEVLQSSWLQQEIKNIRDQRLTDVATRKQSLIGTNVYANLAEQVPYVNKRQSTNVSSNKVLPSVRLAEAFENLREHAKGLEETGRAPIAGLICLDKLKHHKARADFVTGFLATGGIKSVWSPECTKLEDIQTFVKETNFSYYCLCGNDEAYEGLNEKIIEWFQGQTSHFILDIAGKISGEKWIAMKSAGVSDAIYKNQNAIEKLTSLLTLWEVK